MNLMLFVPPPERNHIMKACRDVSFEFIQEGYEVIWRYSRSEGVRRFFSMREFTNRKRSDEDIKGFKVSYYLKEGLNQRGVKDFHATHIEIVDRKLHSNASPDQVYVGIIDGIADFGLFVKFEGGKGLLHRKNLPVSKTEDLGTRYNKGDQIKVKIKVVTPKGVELILN